MPKRRGYRRRRPRRRRRKTKKLPIPNLSPGNMIGLAPRSYMKFRYKTEGTLSGGGASYDAHQFCANGLYDPDITGTGHQPPQFDRMITLYDKYRVYKIKAVATFVNASTTVPIDAAMYLSNESTTEFNPLLHDLTNSQYISSRTLTVSKGARDITTMTRTWDLSKFYGSKYWNEDQFTGSSSSNPGERCFLNIGCNSLNKVDAPDCDYSINITFYTRLEDVSFDEQVLED